jgi:hypothetical protein
MPHCYQPKSSGISLEVTGIKRNVSSEHPRLQRKNSIEFDFASEIPNTKDAILSQRDAVVQYESSIKQTLSYNGDIAITLASDKAKISQLHSSLSPRKPTISSALEKKPKLDKSNSSSKGQAHNTSQLPSLIISLKGIGTVPSDISSNHSVSSHASIMTKSSLECNESIHFKSIASGTFSSNPINIQPCQTNKPDTGIRNAPTTKSDFMEKHHNYRKSNIIL